MATRNVCLSLLFALFVQFAAGQQPAASEGGFKIFFEKVYLHLDRTYYTSGDDIWFKAYLVNAQDNRLLNTSNNLYAELIDPVGKIISRKVIRLDSAVGTGDFKLEDSVLSGTYRVRAYTNWMRNFGNHFVFEKQIRVTSLPIAAGSTAMSAEIKKTAKTNNTKSFEKTFRISFFPEGGNLVADVPTQVAFKAEDNNGKGVDAKGYILNSQGESVASFSSVHSGMGRFSFTPKSNTAYRVFVQYLNNPRVEVSLPQILPDGYVLNVTTLDTSAFVVTIKTNEATTLQHPSGVVNIAARHAGKSYFRQQMTLTNGNASFNIPAKDFPSGIAYITLYDEQMHPHAERLVFVEKENGVSVKVTTDKTLYASKEKAVINVNVSDELQHPLASELSVAVVDDKMDSKNTANIESYLWLESDLPGKIEHPAAYFDKSNESRFQQLDLLLMAQGWRSFLWRKMADTALKISYLPEAGITISGTVTKPFSKKPLGDMNITLFAPEARGDKIYLTKTNANGKYFLDGLPLFGMQTVKINVGDAIGKTVGSLDMDSLYSNPLPVSPLLDQFTDTTSVFKTIETEASRRWSAFNRVKTLQEVRVKTAKRATILEDGSVAMSFGYPEYNFTITRKDWAVERLRDYIVKNVPGAAYDDNMEGVTFLSNGKVVRPIFVVDNREDRFNRLDYYSLPMERIETIRVRHLVGGRDRETQEEDDGSVTELARRGVRDVYLINLTVKPGNADQQLSKITTNVAGYYESRIFYSPDYASEESTRTDERTTIYWAPLLSTGTKGNTTLSFYNADPKGKMRITVQGLTRDGRPVVATGYYEVK